jgi:hypothetical protein
MLKEHLKEEEFEEEKKQIDYLIAQEDIKNQQSDRSMRNRAFYIVFGIIFIQTLFIDWLFWGIGTEKIVLSDKQLNLLVGSTIIEIYVLCRTIVAYLFPDSKGFIVSIIDAIKSK